MDTVQVNVSVNLSGSFKGTAANPSLRSPLSFSNQQALTQAGTGSGFCNQAIDRTMEDQTLAGATTLTIDLRAAGVTYVNPVGETISSGGSNQFGKVRVLYFQHVSASTATTGIRLFNAATDTFSGYLGAGDSITLKPGEDILMESYTTAGMTVDATHKDFTFANLDANPAQYRFFIGGSTN